MLILKVALAFLIPAALIAVLVIVAASIHALRHGIPFGESFRKLLDEMRKAKASRASLTQTSNAQPRFKKRTALMSAAEKQFFSVLTEAVPEAPIFPKVRVADVIEAHKRFSGDFLTISQKHFDWVICHPETYAPLVAVELDDSSHRRERQQQRDATKDTAAREAGLTVIRFAWQPAYDTEKVREIIAEKINAI